MVVIVPTSGNKNPAPTEARTSRIGIMKPRCARTKNLDQEQQSPSGILVIGYVTLR